MRLSAVLHKLGCFPYDHGHERPKEGRGKIWRRVWHKMSRTTEYPMQLDPVHVVAQKSTLQPDVCKTRPTEHGALDQLRYRDFRTKESKKAVTCVSASEDLASGHDLAAKSDLVSPTGSSTKCADTRWTEVTDSRGTITAQASSIAAACNEGSPRKTNEVLPLDVTERRGDGDNRDGEAIGERLHHRHLGKGSTRVCLRMRPGGGSTTISGNTSQILRHDAMKSQSFCKGVHDERDFLIPEYAARTSPPAPSSPGGIAVLKCDILTTTSSDYRSGSSTSGAWTGCSRRNSQDSFMEWINSDRGTKPSKLWWILESAGKLLRNVLCVLVNGTLILFLEVDWALPGFLIFGRLFPKFLQYIRRLGLDTIQMMGCF